jgi:hypothetical protein
MSSSAQDVNKRKFLQRKNMEMAQNRAMDMMEQHPHRYEQNPQLIDGIEDLKELRGSGMNDAGLARVVGKGRTNKRNMECDTVEGSGDMEGGERMLEGGAMEQGKQFGKHLMDIHGGDFLNLFGLGLQHSMTPGKSAKSGKSVKMSGSGSGFATTTQPRQTVRGINVSGATVPRGAVAPLAMGNAPQAPESFERNTVGMGKLSITHEAHEGGRMYHGGEENKGGVVNAFKAIHQHLKERKKMREAKSAPASASVVNGSGKMTRAERGRRVGELMREHGCSLGEASKMLKEM